jgi:hypothetical protein
MAVMIFVCLMLSARPGRAQDGTSFSNLDVALWPEYDRQGSVLVIYKITLPPSVSLPADLTLRIPAAAGEPNAVAIQEADGVLRDVNYQRQVSGEWAAINFTATMPEIQFEYYDPALKKQGAQRNYEYRWPGDYPVDFLTIEVQQPLGASQMQFSPATDSSVTGRDGLVYYTKRVGDLPGGQTFSQQISYEKESDALTAGEQQVQPSAPMSSSPSTLGSLRAALPWVLGVLGVALLVGGAVWYWQSGKDKESGKPRRRRRSADSQPQPTGGAEGHIYCHQCGKRAAPGDRFCRTCGTKLRIE